MKQNGDSPFLNKAWLVNILIATMIGLIGYQAHSYDSKFEKLSFQIEKKADKMALDALCARLDEKASKSRVDLLSGHLEKQFDLLYDEIKGLRKDINYYLRDMIPQEKRGTLFNEFPSGSIQKIDRGDAFIHQAGSGKAGSG